MSQTYSIHWIAHRLIYFKFLIGCNLLMLNYCFLFVLSANPCNCGKCVNLPGSYRCNCDQLTTGEHCEIDINECDNKSVCSVEPRGQGHCAITMV